MMDDLKEFKVEELRTLEEKVKNARLPTEDLFGISRRFCTVCEQACQGYQAITLAVPQSGEFPSFCKNCKCPAHFHQVSLTESDIKFPVELKDTIQNHNITS